MDARSIILDRISLLRRELDQLEALVGGSTAARPTPTPVVTAPRPAPAPVAAHALRPAERPPVRRGPRRPTPEDLDLDAHGIGPAQAAELLGVARQTIDRRLREGRSDVPGAPRDVSGGALRSRWRWADEAQVRRWWAAVR